MTGTARNHSASTAAVLWLMILLVFLPIAAAHLMARHFDGPAPEAPQVGELGSHPGHG